MKRILKYIIMFFCSPAALADAVNNASDVDELDRNVLNYRGGSYVQGS